MHYYSHNIGDYRKDTSHLSTLEHGIYRQLIDWYYLDEKPIPKETQVVLRRLRLVSNSDAQSLQNVLDDFFILEDDGYHQARCDVEIADYRRNSEKNKANGKLGGRPKKTHSVILGNPSETQPKGNQEPITNNHKPRTSNTGDGAKPELFGFDVFWGAYDKKVERPAAEKSWKRLSPGAELLERIIAAVAVYVASTPDKTYRKNPSTWLNNKCWDDEVIIRGASPQASQGLNKQEALEHSNAGVADRFIQKLEAQGAFN